MPGWKRRARGSTHLGVRRGVPIAFGAVWIGRPTQRHGLHPSHRGGARRRVRRCRRARGLRGGLERALPRGAVGAGSASCSTAAGGSGPVVVVAPGSFRALGLTWSGNAPTAIGGADHPRRPSPSAPGRSSSRTRTAAGRAEAARGTPTASEPLWVGRADRVQVRTRGAVVERARGRHRPGLDPPLRPARGPRRRRRCGPARHRHPGAVGRRRVDALLEPRITTQIVRCAVVHHTAGNNDLHARPRRPAIVRAIYPTTRARCTGRTSATRPRRPVRHHLRGPRRRHRQARRSARTSVGFNTGSPSGSR